MTSRRRLLALVALALPLAEVRAETALPRPLSLPLEAAAAAARGEPLVLLVSLPGCPYCERVRRTELLPLARESGGGVVQLDINSTAQVIDFGGATRSHDAVTERLHARFTPTVLFLGTDGAELAERLVGAGIPDFYGAILQQRLEQARAAVRRPGPPAGQPAT